MDRDITSFGRELASSEIEVREKSLEDVRNWMSCAPFNGKLARCKPRGAEPTYIIVTMPVEINEGDMIKLWLGLYMSMWMADKPLVQVWI